MADQLFQINGNQFRIFKHKSKWKLYWWHDREWVTLSEWRTRKEALTAAECFVPAEELDRD